MAVEGAASGEEELPEEVTAKLGAALLFISEGVRWGEGPQLASMAVRMLPSLVRLQVRTYVCVPRKGGVGIISWQWLQFISMASVD